MPNTFTYLLKRLWDEITRLFSLHLDTDEAGTTENVKKSIEFRGGNLWALIFACLIASIGLNTNSTAVVIGAMLISPLMGPIVGVGFSVATNDFGTLKYSLRNLVLMIVLSIGAAAFYFLLSPLKEPTAELIARTQPSLYDVLIAVLGGVVGIVASSRRDRGNAIPGVAIATALMPPLCTAGYGLATLQLEFFMGAFYLFFINSIFIALTTMIVVRSLQFPQIEFLDKKREKQMKWAILLIVVVTVVPSVFTAIHVVNEAIFTRRVKDFVSENLMMMEKSEVLQYKAKYASDSSVIEVIMFGEELSDERIAEFSRKLKNYELEHTFLDIHQSTEKRPTDLPQQNFDVSKYEEIYRRKTEEIESRESQIRELREEIARMKAAQHPIHKANLDKISRKIAALYPDIEAIGLSEVVKSSQLQDSVITDTLPTALIHWKNSRQADKYTQNLSKYLQLELGLDTVEVVNY
ncbi:DUF389 domain-containing protein [Saprospira grandis]|uniref:Membrane protein n=1 Tax=Saprospira grandis (strain Lewin) TaxID=984262 RepID=H6KZ84_SAPGL|nr:DUF389 domain-containing protein [Saprospira grandis]AFC24474.1 putative membrane protein [Saprospira grandis str. Lewin]